MPEIQYPTNPNSDTAFVVQEDGTKNRALMTAPQDTSTLELPSNANSTKGYVTIDGKKQRVVLTAVLAGGGDSHNLGYYATQAALEEAHPTAEAGDWAIVGATDTVWIWDTDNSAWVDSDQKGQVTSVNGQTGAVTLSIPDAVQYSAMPTASVDNLGDIVQFTGTTDANYTNGYFYKCVSDGQEPATYSWSQVSVQPAPSGLPDQTGQSGKFLTTDGTDASWSDKPLVNQSTSANELAIGNNVTPNNSRGVRVGSSITGGVWSSNGIFIGNNIDTGQYKKGVFLIPNDGSAYTPTGDVVIGEGAGKGNNIYSGCISIGTYAQTSTGANAIAVGFRAQTTAEYAIQLGATGNSTTNSDANTFKVANSNGNYEIMSADGTVPTARLTKVNTTATLAVADWSSSTQTVTVSGVKADSVVFVSPDPTSASDYASAGILCTSQSADSLTFTATTTPTNAITVNVVCM